MSHENDPDVRLTPGGTPYKMGFDLKVGERVKIIEWVPGVPHQVEKAYTVVEPGGYRLTLEDEVTGKHTSHNSEQGFFLVEVQG